MRRLVAESLAADVRPSGSNTSSSSSGGTSGTGGALRGGERSGVGLGDPLNNGTNVSHEYVFGPVPFSCESVKTQR